MTNTALHKMQMLTFDGLTVAFARIYIYENGESTFNKIMSKIDNPKVQRYIESLANVSDKPTFKEILITLNSIPYFMLSKAETFCIGALGVATIWSTNCNNNYWLLSSEMSTSMGIDIITSSARLKTKINENIFDRFFNAIERMEI